MIYKTQRSILTFNMGPMKCQKQLKQYIFEDGSEKFIRRV